MKANSHQIINISLEERLIILAELLLEIVLEDIDDDD